MKSEHLESTKYWDLTEADLDYERRVGKMRRQEHLVGDRSELKKLALLLAVCAGGMWAYWHHYGSNSGFLYSILKGKKVLESMTGELNQEKKIWEFVDK